MGRGGGMTSAHPYSGRHAVLATMHGKEAAIRGPFLDGLGLEVLTPQGIDTDAFGTFSGEIRREKGVRDTAVAKARLGMKMTGLPIGIASEGAFGPHPEIPIIAADMELMVLVDDQRGMVLTETIISDETNFSHVEAGADEYPDAFINQAKFPGHGLIVAANKPLRQPVSFEKGIADEARLRAAIRTAAAQSFDGKAFV
jgi:hypothetical protein